MRMQRFVLSFAAFCGLIAFARSAAAQPQAVVSPNSLNFNNVHLGTAPTLDFDIQNSGTGNVDVLTPGFTPDAQSGCPDYSFNPTSANNIANGSPVTFTATFAPGARGVRSCTFTVLDDDGNLDTLAVTGVGTNPLMATSTGSLAFGDVHIGNAPTQTVTVTNNSPSNETLTYTAAVTGTTEFTVSPESGSILVGGMQVFTVTYTPTNRGADAATLTISGNDFNNASDTVSLSGTGTSPSMTTSPGSLAFGNIDVGMAAPTQNVTITNTMPPGNEDLVWTAVVTAGNTDYSVAPAGGTLAPGASTMVTVSFTPTVRGARPGTLTISGNDTGTPNASDAISLTGTGTAPVMVTSPSSLDCGSARVAGGIQTCDITIQNTTTDAGKILTWSGSVTLGGTDYAITTMGDTTLNPGQSTTMTITFNPTAAGTRLGQVTITGDDPLNPSDVVALTGVGTVAIVSLSPSPMPFGSVHVNTNFNQTLVIDNSATLPGANDLTVTSMAISGADASQFAFTDHGCSGQACTLGTPIVVSPGADFENVVIRCRPTSRGDKTATLTITGDQDSGANTVTLTCTGTEPEINLTDTDLAFGNEIIGGTNPQLTFSIENTFTGTGQETLDFTITKGGANPTIFTVSPPCTSTCTVAPGGSQLITVTFTPTARQAYSATLTIASDDIDEPSLIVTLSGTGIAPVIGNPMPAGLTLAFPNTDVGATSAPLSASIQNTGDSALNISSVTLVGAQANQFAITSGSTGAHVVAAGASDAWNVVCQPTAPFGAKSATLRIASDALGAVTFDFTLTCTAEQAVFVFSPPAGLAFGGVDVGMASTLPVTITNNGNQPGTVQSIISGNSVYTFNVIGGAPPRVLAAGGGSITVDVTFTPVNGNVVSSNLTVMTDGSPTSFTIPLSGDGQTFGLDVSVEDELDLMVDLGERRVGVTVPKLVTVQNTGDTAYLVTPIPSSDDANCAIQAVSPLSYPAVVPPGGGFITFRVNTTPTVLGADDCTVTINSDIPQSRTIDFTFVGVAPGIDLVNPANGVLDYAGVDVDTSQTQTVTILNDGDFLLTVSSCSLTGSTAFSLATPCGTPITVAEGLSTTLDVVFDPTIESAETATLTLNTDAFMELQVVVMLSGVGTDQHIELPATEYTFPPTFRNPDDDDVPVEMIVVGNPLHPVTGQASPMNISMAVTEATFEDVFVVTDQGPYDVSPGGQVEIPVEFRPTAAGTTFEATITIFNNTTALPMAQVTVTGEGISREVMVGSGVYDFGTTGVGIPVRLSDLIAGGLSVTNIDDDEAYVVRGLAFVDSTGAEIDGGAFRIVDGSPERDLPVAGTERYDIEFAPEEASDNITILLAVYLDGDPEAHYVVMLQGAAVDVEVRGGGGCQAGGGGRGTLALVVLALALVLARRRRGAALLAVLSLGAIGLAAAPARAEPTRNIEISTFAPAPATEVEGFAIESPVVGLDGAWALGLSVNYATNVLMVVAAGDEAMADVPVTNRTAFQLGFAYAFLGQFEAGVRLPFYQQAGDMPTFSGLQPADGNALGDAAVHAKARLLATDSIALAVSIDVTVPTATDDEFAGVDGPSGHVRAIGGWRSHRVAVTGNAGFVARQPGDLGDISQGNAFTFGAGTHFRALESLWVIGETFGSSGMGSAGAGVQQLEGVLGIRYEIARSVGVSVGGGRGIMTGIGSPDLRGFLLLDVSPRARKVDPLVVEKPRPPRDTGDDDGDGVVNADDECRGDAEDEDDYHDDDGCPEADNDEDGLLDAADKCPNEPEDADGFQDDDGCADRDNDNDKIADVDDKCPNEAEDPDGYLDNDGCDEPDNDTDGIPDVIDQCALEAETINGNNDDDGCPDNGDSLVMVMPDRIEIFEAVTFDGTGAKLSKKSANVLGQVAATLRANREFKRMRVTVHVHPRGGGDQDLSEKRAKAIREWLVQWGIEPERVESRGLGSSRPLVPKKQKGAAQLNDRVEFIILEKDVK